MYVHGRLIEWNWVSFPLYMCVLLLLRAQMRRLVEFLRSLSISQYSSASSHFRVKAAGTHWSHCSSRNITIQGSKETYFPLNISFPIDSCNPLIQTSGLQCSPLQCVSQADHRRKVRASLPASQRVAAW